MLFSVELFQDRPVGGKVLPAAYELVMCNQVGNEVSDGHRVVADMVAQDTSSRVLRVGFALRAGVSYDPHQPYYLVCRGGGAGGATVGDIVWKEEFHIDIPFAPLDDFGF